MQKDFESCKPLFFSGTVWTVCTLFFFFLLPCVFPFSAIIICKLKPAERASERQSDRQTEERGTERKTQSLIVFLFRFLLFLNLQPPHQIINLLLFFSFFFFKKRFSNMLTAPSDFLCDVILYFSSNCSAFVHRPDEQNHQLLVILDEKLMTLKWCDVSQSHPLSFFCHRSRKIRVCLGASDSLLHSTAAKERQQQQQQLWRRGWGEAVGPPERVMRLMRVCVLYSLMDDCDADVPFFLILLLIKSRLRSGANFARILSRARLPFFQFHKFFSLLSFWKGF